MPQNYDICILVLSQQHHCLQCLFCSIYVCVCGKNCWFTGNCSAPYANKWNIRWKTEVMQHIMTFKTCPNWSISHLTRHTVHTINSAYLQNLMHAFTIASSVAHHQNFSTVHSGNTEINTLFHVPCNVL